MLTSERGSFGAGDQTQGLCKPGTILPTELYLQSLILLHYGKVTPGAKSRQEYFFSRCSVAESSFQGGDPCDLLLCFILTSPQAGRVGPVRVCAIIIPRMLPG